MDASCRGLSSICACPSFPRERHASRSPVHDEHHVTTQAPEITSTWIELSTLLTASCQFRSHPGTRPSPRPAAPCDGGQRTPARARRGRAAPAGTPPCLPRANRKLGGNGPARKNPTPSFPKPRKRLKPV